MMCGRRAMKGIDIFENPFREQKCPCSETWDLAPDLRPLKPNIHPKIGLKSIFARSGVPEGVLTRNLRRKKKKHIVKEPRMMQP
jgi:hypothetical protein